MNIASALLLVVIMWIMGATMPSVTRSTLFFAVTVAPGFRTTSEARRIARRYQVRLTVHAVIAAGLTVVAALVFREPHAASPTALLVEMTVAGLWMLVGMISALFRARQATLPYAVAPSSVREVPLRRPSRSFVRSWPWTAVILSPLAMLLLAGVYTAVYYDAIPERYPSHWNLHGEVDGWTSRSPLAVFWPLLVGVASYPLLPLIIWTIRRARRTATSLAEAQRSEVFRAWTEVAGSA